MHVATVPRLFGSLGALFVIGLGLTLGLSGCQAGGDSKDPSSTTTLTPVSSQLAQQAVSNILTLYRQALMQEDIDRLQGLLQSQDTPPAQTRIVQRQEGASVLKPQAFLDAMTVAFTHLIITALDVPADAIVTAADYSSVTFFEIESSADVTDLRQQTRLFRTTLHLTQTDMGNKVAFRISDVQREGPLVQITTPGQIQAGALARLDVTGTGVPFVLSGVEVEIPETGSVQALEARDRHFKGLFSPMINSIPQPLRVHLHGPDGTARTLSHRYQPRLAGDGAVQPIATPAATRLFAVTIASDGTVWAGGDGGGRVVQVMPGTTTAGLVGQLLEDPTGRVEDLTFDRLDRLHAIVFAPQVSGDIILDQGISCQTVNVLDRAGHPDPAYPLQVTEIRTGTARPSPSTRAIAAGGGDVWLFGSDGGVARAIDSFRGGQCQDVAVTVRYDPIFRRAASALPTNTVPALVAGSDGTLWFGTALGLVRWRDGQFTSLVSASTLSVQGQAATLEAFFQEVAQAIFAARPLTTVAIGTVSFVDAFGGPLNKEDLIFSAVEDLQGRIWVGTLGGGLRRFEQGQQTLHLTQQDGLPSNLILALAVGPDGAIWAATDAGVSRFQAVAGPVTMTTFTALDGLTVPVRDVAVDSTGVAWLATDGGLLRIFPQGRRLQGLVLDPTGQPLAGVDVTVRGTPMRAVTDGTGHFGLANLPPGTHRLQFIADFVSGSPWTSAQRDVALITTDHLLEPVVLAPLAPSVAIDPVHGGTVTFAAASGAVLEFAPGTLHLPVGAAPEIRVSLLPLTALPVPVPVGVTVGAAADLRPAGVTFTVPARLTLPNQGGLAAGQLVGLLRLDEATLTYVQIGVGRVSDDGTVITTTGGGIIGSSTIIFARIPVIAQAQIIAIAGDGQTNTIGRSLPTPLTVAVRDGAGQGLPGIPVTFTVIAGDSTVTPASTHVTDAQGQASTVVTLGRQVGPQDVTATVPGLAPVHFTATALPARLIQVAGNNQVAAPGVTLPEPLVVRLEDQFGVPFVGETVTARVIQGQAEFLAAQVSVGTTQTTVTDAQGEARFVLRVGQSTNDIVVAVSALDQEVQFLTVVGFSIPFGIAVESTKTLVVADTSLAAILRVDPHTGTRTVVSATRPGSGTRIGRGPHFEDPKDIALEPDGRLVVLDGFDDLFGGLRALVRVDPHTGDRTIISDVQTGRGPPFENPLALTVGPAGQIIVVDPGITLPARVVRVDPVTGDRTIVSDASTGPPFDFPNAVAFEAAGQLVVLDAGRVSSPQIIRIDPGTGVRTSVSDASKGGGPSLLGPVSLAVESTGTLIVLEGGPLGRAAVMRVDAVTGDRTSVSDAQHGSGPPLRSPIDITTEADGRLVLVDIGPGTVLRVDPNTGERTTVSAGLRAGNGPLLVNPIGITTEADGKLIVVDGLIGLSAVVRVDPQTGDRTLVSSPSLGNCPFFLNPLIPVVEADGHLVVVDAGFGAFIGDATLSGTIIRVDPRSGTCEVLSDAIAGGGPSFGGFLSGIAVEPGGTLVTVEAVAPRVIRLHPVTGTRSIVSGCPANDATGLCLGSILGQGPPFVDSTSIALELDGNLLVVDGCDPIFGCVPAVVRVDPRTGDRAIVSDANRGAGPALMAPLGFAVEANGHIVVADGQARAIVRVDPRTGDRTIVSGGTSMRGVGIPFIHPSTITVEANGHFVVVDDFIGLKALIRVDPIRGDRTIISK